MIDAKELRVNNWVEVEHTDETTSHQQITEINRNGIKTTGLHVWKVNGGIPITPEVLEACDWNGYKSLYIDSYFNLDTYGHLYYGSDYTGINVEYLHQLQNLYFALTGQELIYTPKGKV